MASHDDQLLRRPIIVVGSGRSGMNFLGRAIARHPDLVAATEPRLMWKHGNDGLSDALQPRHARPEVIARIRAQVAAFVRSNGKRRYVDVTPGNSLRLAFVDRVFPDAVYVHFIRDGVDNVLSMRRFYGVVARTLRPNRPQLRDSYLARRTRELSLRQVPGMALEAFRHVVSAWLFAAVGPPVKGVRLPGMTAMRQEIDLLDLCFLQWRSSVESAAHFGRSLPPGRYREYRIESFDEAQMRQIYAFCGLDRPEPALEYMRREFDRRRIGPALDDGFPSELDRLRLLVAPTMAWLADAVGTAPPRTPGETPS